MNQNLNGHLVLKIGILTSILLASYQVITLFIPTSDTPEIVVNENAQIYKSAYSANLGNIGVALSTRVGLQYQGESSNLSSNSFYKEIANIGSTPQEKAAIRSDLIAQNMLIIREYLNISRTDIKSILDSSSDRRSTIEGFISQLELRYKNSALSLQSLEKQKTLLLADISKIESSIESTKSSMETHFSASQAKQTLDDVDKYFDLRAQYTQAFTDIVFINQFIKQHAFLNSYNKGILDTLINNKEAIINQTYVVIPDSGDEYLRPLELIFDEAEIKAKNTSN